MKTIDSSALELVNKALGLTGAGAPITELLDGSVDQVLDVAQIARRGLTPAGSEGIFRGVFQTTHVGADTQSTAIELYNVNAALAIAPWPVPVPNSLDIWILGASLVRVSGGGTMVGILRLTNLQQGWGIDELGAAVPSTEPLVIAFWNGINATSPTAFGVTQTREPFKRLAIRLPRNGGTAAGPFLGFQSQASIAAVFQCVVLLGMFPVSLGQDALG